MLQEYVRAVKMGSASTREREQPFFLPNERGAKARAVYDAAEQVLATLSSKTDRADVLSDHTRFLDALKAMRIDPNADREKYAMAAQELLKQFPALQGQPIEGLIYR